MSELVQTEFTISYDATGDLEHHIINAKDLGNAIIGMHELITKAATIVSNGSSEAELKVIAPAKEGSLAIIFAMLADPLTTITVLKSIGIGVAAAAVSSSTAIGIIDRLKDRKIERVVIDAKTQKATIETKDESIETTSHVAQLVASKDIRQALYKVVQAPLQGRGAATISFITDAAEVVLSEPEIKNFSPIRSDVKEKETKETIHKTVQFTKLNFNSRRSWTIQSKDGFEASVTIRDDAFMAKVSGNEEAFKKEKFYVVELEKTETTNVSGTKIKYDIVQVVSEAT